SWALTVNFSQRIGMAFVPLLPCHSERSEEPMQFGGSERMQRSFASLRMTDLLDFQITNYKLPITNLNGRRLPCRLPLSLHLPGFIVLATDRWQLATALRRFAGALAFERLLAADVHLDLLRLGLGFLGQ